MLYLGKYGKLHVLEDILGVAERRHSSVDLEFSKHDANSKRNTSLQPSGCHCVTTINEIHNGYATTVQDTIFKSETTMNACKGACLTTQGTIAVLNVQHMCTLCQLSCGSLRQLSLCHCTEGKHPGM